MAREAVQSSKWDYNVNLIKLMKPDGKWSGLYGTEREDTGEVFEATTAQYGLVQNKELMDVALAALEKRKMKDFEQKVVVTNGGAKMFAEFTFKNKQLANAVGDIFGYKLTLQNSFDRSLRASFVLGFLRLTCLNGASTLEKEFGANRKHSTKITVDFVTGAIDKAIERGPEALKIYDGMAKVLISDEKGLNILAQLEDKGVLSGTVRENITSLWLAPRRQEDKARNLYNLYNAATEYLTHKVAPERYEYAAKTDNSVLLTLVNASRKPEYLQKLLLPVPKKGVTMTAQGPVIDV